MLTLHYHPISGLARAARVILHEKGVPCTLRIEPFWERRPNLAALNPECLLPILEDGDLHIGGADAVYAYIEELHPEPNLRGSTPHARAEITRIGSWFMHKFSYEVVDYVTHERLVRYFAREGAPRSEWIRAAAANLRTHLDYIQFLLRDNRLLVGDKLSHADIIAACQLSVLDYLGDVPWKDYPQAREWYALIKSRPSFRPLLQEVFTGFPASPQYAMLDF